VSATLELFGVSVYRDDPSRGARKVVNDVSLDVAPGERVFLTGPNGAGKTSLLLAIVGAARFDGRVRVCGTTLASETLARIRAQVGFVFADPGDQLFCDTVFDEVAFGPIQRGLDPGVVRERVLRALSAVGLQGFEARHPGALSQGEQRRLALATALSVEPGLILCDEPTASLDPLAREGVLSTLNGLSAALLVATHDLDAALSLDARVVLMKEGAIVADGPAGALLSDDILLGRAGLARPLSLSRRS
jgi:cobalt/nickel transport system ATP-binding protein